MTEEQTHILFRRWCDANPEAAKALQDRLGYETFRSYKKRPVKNVDRIGLARKVILYQTTGIEAFKPGQEFESLLDVDIEAIRIGRILSGQEPRDHIYLWLELNGKSKQDLVRECGLNDPAILDRYISGDSIIKKNQQKIEETLRQYAKQEQSLKPQVDKPTTEKAIPSSKSTQPSEVYSSQVPGISQLVTSIDNLTQELARQSPNDARAKLLNRVNIPLETRIDTVVQAIEILAEELDYFRRTSDSERKKLVDEIDTDLWGYVNNILNGIHKPESFDTVMRLYPSPLSFRRRRGKK